VTTRDRGSRRRICLVLALPMLWSIAAFGQTRNGEPRSEGDGPILAPISEEELEEASRAAMTQDVSQRGRPIVPGDKIYIAYKNPADPGPFWWHAFDDKAKAHAAIREMLEHQNPDLNPYIEDVDKDQWNSGASVQNEVIDRLRRRSARKKVPPMPKSHSKLTPRVTDSPFPPKGSDSSRRGLDPPFTLQNVEPDVMTGRGLGVRQIEPQVRAPRRGGGLSMDESAKKSERPSESSQTAAADGKTRSRHAAPSRQGVRRPRPDAQTGFPVMKQRTARPAPSSTADRRGQQKPHAEQRQPRSNKLQLKRPSPPSYYPPFVPPFQGGHG
jgi:hypothetical protein